MRGERKPRGLVERAGKIEGVNYKGDPAGVSQAWGGGAAGVATPAIGEYPTVTLPIDENDDASDKLRIVRAASRGSRKLTRDTTKARFRSQLKTFANFIAWIMDVIAGTRTMKGLALDATGGTGGAVVPPGGIIATGGAVLGGDLELGGAVLYDNPITKKIWVHGSWLNVAGFPSWNYNGADNSWTSQAGSSSILLAIPIPAGPGTYTLTSLTLRMKKAGTSATGFAVGHSHGLSTTSGDVAITVDATIVDSTIGNRLIDAPGLALAMTDDIAVIVSINSADNGDKVYGVEATFTATHGG